MSIVSHGTTGKSQNPYRKPLNSKPISGFNATRDIKLSPNANAMVTQRATCKSQIPNSNKENNVFKDALGVKGLGFKHHGNHPCNHGSHYGNHHGNYHDNHSNHHGSYHAEQLLFSCQFSKVSSCQVVRLCAYHVYSTASNLAIRSQTMLTGIILYYLVT